MVIVGQDRLEVLAGAQPQHSQVVGSTGQLLRAVLRVTNLQASIQFYSQHFGLALRTLLDAPGGLQRAIVAADTETDVLPTFCLELVEAEAGEEPPGCGDYLAHFTIIVQSTSECLQRLKEAGLGNLIQESQAAVIPVRSTNPEGHQTTQDLVAVVQDINGYTWRVMEMHRAPPDAERLCTLALRTTSLERSVMWFSFLLGMEVHQEYVAPQPPEYKTVLLGYGPELRATQLELRQTADPPLHDRGSGFVRLVIAVDSLEAAREALTGAGEDFEEGFELPSVMDVLSPGQPALKCTAPDGWEVCLVQCC